ncbi:CoA-binding protein [Thermodesulfobacteriota bacterium]
MTSNASNLDFIFHPRSVALVGITLSNPAHWTRVYLDCFLKYQFQGPVYPVNPKGGEVKGLKVYRNLEDIPGDVDYVISTVPAQAAPSLMEASARKGVKGINFCTSGFSETGEEEGIRLEKELVRLSKETSIRIIGPNSMGIYCPESRLSFDTEFPEEGGPVAFLSQSGGNVNNIVRQAKWRGVRFSKVISYGNACDLNECDFLEYLAHDRDTQIVALYIEGVEDGDRFREALTEVAKEKHVVILKGGKTAGGVRAVEGHTSSMAGSEVIWDSLSRQLKIIQVHSLADLTDVLVTLQFMRRPQGKNACLLGIGGGSSVLITDAFEKSGFHVPQLTQTLIRKIREYTPPAGNILHNPLDCGNFDGLDKVVRTIKFISEWKEIDFFVGFQRMSVSPTDHMPQIMQMTESLIEASQSVSKPMAAVAELIITPSFHEEVFPVIQKYVDARIPIYYSFSGAAHAMGLCFT